MKIAKRTLMISAISCLGVAIIMLICGVFGVKVFEAPLLNIMLIFAMLTVSCVLSLNALTIMSKKKIISIMMLSLVGLLTIFGIIIISLNFNSNVIFNKITLILALITVFSNFIVTYYINLGKKFLVLQILCDSFIVVVDVMLTLQICDVDIFGNNIVSKIFIALCLVTFAFICTLSIISGKNQKLLKQNESEIAVKQVKTISEDKIEISKVEYEEMKDKIAKLENELNKLKTEQK